MTNPSPQPTPGEPPYLIADKEPVFPCELFYPGDKNVGPFWSPTLHEETWRAGMPGFTHWRPMRPQSPGNGWADEAAVELLSTHNIPYGQMIAGVARIILKHAPSAQPAKMGGGERIDRTNVIRNAVIKWEITKDGRYNLDNVVADIIAAMDVYYAPSPLPAQQGETPRKTE